VVTGAAAAVAVASGRIAVGKQITLKKKAAFPDAASLCRKWQISGDRYRVSPGPFCGSGPAFHEIE
jgi:hypothetical protein